MRFEPVTAIVVESAIHMVKVKKAVIIAAGFGTRFLPASKSIPKVMFPVIDKPIIQIIVEEIVKAGIKDITFVVSPLTSFNIKSHFSSNKYLNSVLKKGNKKETLGILKNIETCANFKYINQKPGRIGSGVAILSAKKSVVKQPFLLMFADDFLIAEPGFVVQLVNNYHDKKSCLLGCIRTTNPIHGTRFGFITGKKAGKHLIRVESMVEKPGYGKAPSPFASMVGIIFPPSIFAALEKADKEFKKDKELYHTEGIQRLISQNKKVFGLEYQNAEYFDTGDKFGYIQALIRLGLKDKSMGKDLRKFIAELKLSRK